MSEPAAKLAAFDPGLRLSASDLLDASPYATLALDAQDSVRFANPAAEQLLGISAGHIIGHPLSEIVAADSPLFALVAQARRRAAPLAESELALEGPRLGLRQLALDVAPLAERPGWVMLHLREPKLGERIERQTVKQGAARSLNAVGALLAHEIKNPLSGIRGAAQLLEAAASEGGRELTTLICDEVDRIRALVDRMEAFADLPIESFAPVNIHEALDHALKLARAGFARDREIVESYDPSLPPVHGNRDLLIQLFLNLLKNAAEATEPGRGRLTLRSRYRQGAKLARADGSVAPFLPIAVAIEDNGPGIDETLRDRLFDPFVSTKPGGRGLGLALAMKIATDHGGAIELETRHGQTIFTVLLPQVRRDARTEPEASL